MKNKDVWIGRTEKYQGLQYPRESYPLVENPYHNPNSSNFDKCCLSPKVTLPTLPK